MSEQAGQGMNRRKWLRWAGLLGLAGGVAGSWWKWGRPETRKWKLVDAGLSWKAGHRYVREHAPALMDGEVAHYDVVIVGGGMTGLTAGWWLQRQGVENFTVLELEPTPGGNSGWGQNGVSAYPWGAHYVPILNEEATYARQLFEEMGIITGAENGLPVYNELMLCHDPEERLFRFGQWQEGLVPKVGVKAEELAQMGRFFAEMETWKQRKGRDGKPAFAIPVGHSSTDPALRALDKLTFRAWLTQQGYTAEPLLWYLNYACRDDFGLTLDTTSAWAGLHYFAARRGQAANADPGTVLTWPNGNGWLVQQLAGKLGKRIATGQLVRELKQETDRVRLQVVATDGRSAREITAKAVVLAVPVYIAQRLLPDIKLPVKAYTHTPWVVVNLTLSRPPAGQGAALAWDNVSAHSESLGYIVAPHQQMGRTELPTVITWYLPLTHTDAATARKEAFETPVETWAERALADLERLHPGIGNDVLEVAVRVWGHGMVGPTPGLLWSGVREQTAKAVKGRVVLAHTDLAGMSIFEEAQEQGVLAAQAVLRMLHG